MADNSGITNNDQIKELLVEVTRIDTTLKVGIKFLKIGIVLIGMIGGTMYLKLYDLRASVTKLESSVHAVEGSVDAAVQPIKQAATDVSTSAGQVKDAATAMKEAAGPIKSATKDVNSAVTNLNAAAASLGKVVARLETADRVRKLTTIITMHSENIKPFTEFVDHARTTGYQTPINLPQAVHPQKVVAIEVRFARGTPIIPDTTPLLTSLSKGALHWAVILVPETQIGAFETFFNTDQKKLNLEVIVSIKLE